MRRFMTALAVLTASSIPLGDPATATLAGGQAPSPAVTSITTHSVRLSLQLIGTAFPGNALIRAVVRLTNFSGRPITTWDCPASSLGAEVVSGSGIALYPPLLPPPGAPWSYCAGAIAQPRVLHVLQIGPGKTVVRTTRVLLRTPAVRAWADLRLDPAQGKPTVIETPLLHLRTIPVPGPRVLLRTSQRLQAEVIPVPGAGPILYSQFAYCRDAAHASHPMVTDATFSRWRQASERVLRPFTVPCTSLAEWSLFVAQPNRPIAHVYYCPHPNLCDYAPPTPQQQAVAACKQDVARAVLSGRLPREAARYALGLTSTLPGGLSPGGKALARAFHDRCAPLIKKRGPA